MSSILPSRSQDQGVDISIKSENQRVLWVPFEGTVELGLAPYIQRAVEYANSNQYDAIVLEVDTFGGRVDAAVEIRDALIDSKITTVAWVNKRAISAGALISLACDKIFYSKGSTMGAATPVQQGGEGAQDVGKKYVSYFRGEMGSTAEQNGRSRKLAEAMVQATEGIEGLVKEGDVLTLTDVTALEHGMSDGTLSSRADVLAALKLEGATITEFGINWAERIVRVLTDPTVSGLLMSGGVLGIIFELQSPGFGLPGIIGLSCLALFFGAKFLVHLAGWEEILLLMVGLILIGLEFLIFPGTYIFVILGLAAILVSLFMAGVSPKIPLDFNMPSIQDHVQAMGTGFVLFFIGLALVLWYFSKNPRAVPLGLSDHFEAGSGHSKQETDERKALVSQTGILTTDLRPSGKAEINGKSYQVVAESGFINSGAEIEVIDVEGVRILVREKR